MYTLKLDVMDGGMEGWQNTPKPTPPAPSSFVLHAHAHIQAKVKAKFNTTPTPTHALEATMVAMIPLHPLSHPSVISTGIPCTTMHVLCSALSLSLFPARFVRCFRPLGGYCYARQLQYLGMAEDIEPRALTA
ncbi:hypothetical protein FOQG_03368 [Fusarium oxysporum f. sp. raphani 54005]|uniref:Uncharacterized protein n=2 Tax=Fusarium oxysporum TaxID=5507 RepID=X0DPP7_FUSOX|nr:hypothetical protein FOQG_03368 [Fusarium oxysporum f. sp. raphani 54005]EXM30488.1 hypothetical protein FOTG_04447 [Fusarium oxysporum f. sp. vasinfectum 25433]KAK2693178.1 hypothetical protein QWA68_009624 [Fusarium oxysporum]